MIDADGENINYKTEYLIDGRKRIFYEPTVIGPVEIHISKDNEPIDGSPIIVNAFDPSAVNLIDFPDKIQINATNRFIIDPTKAGKGSLKVSVKGPNNRSLPITVLKRSNGPHTIFVLFNRIPIPETPLRVFVESKDVKRASNEPIEERTTYRGHGIIEQYQRLKDGSLRLVLHFDKPEQSDWEQIRGEYSIQIKKPLDDNQESIVRSTQTSEVGERERGRSLYPKQHDQERARSLSSQTILDPVHSRLSKSNENIAQLTSQKYSTSPNEQQNRERSIKLEDRYASMPSIKPLSSLQIQQFNSIKEKFEHQQPIDVVFGMKDYFVVRRYSTTIILTINI
ncbi:unnamed protein product [Rotaria sp. Silwood2]|nr:unnamed protein product [Rotaria sp. Silwood2]